MGQALLFSTALAICSPPLLPLTHVMSSLISYAASNDMTTTTAQWHAEKKSRKPPNHMPHRILTSSRLRRSLNDHHL
jgi:hypothetical protein